MKKIFTKAAILVIILFFSLDFATAGNAPVTTIPAVKACPGGAVVLPVTVTGFTGISSISLRIEYDAAVMTFGSVSNVNSAFAGLMSNDLVSSGTIHKIMIAWTDVTAQSLANGSKLFDLNFTYISGTTAVNFNNIVNGGSECEYADVNGDAMNDTPDATYYINGQVSTNAVGTPGTITGSASVCAGVSGIAYSVPAVTNASTYVWSYSGTGVTIVNPGNTNSITINFSVVATSGNLTVYGTNTCGNGPTSAPLAITVNPIPSVTNNPLSKQICSGSSTGIALTSGVSGTTFSWTATPSSGNVSGFLAGSGTTINQTLSNSGYSVETVTYHITPSANGCTGAIADYVVTVYPVPNVSNNPLSKQICSGSATSITLTSNVAGTTFTWTAALTSGTVTGFSGGSGTQLNQTLVNTAYTIGTVTYHITPLANTCTGTAVDYVVTVYPVADVYFNPSSLTICSQQTASINLLSHVTGTTFTWTASLTTGTATGFSNGTGSSISQVLTNTGTTTATVTYVVTPTANSCTGTLSSIVVTINPKPALTTSPLTASICSGSTTNIILTANVTGTTFAWTVNQTGVTGASAGSGSTIAQTLVTSGAVSGTATYHITPSANACTGTVTDYVVTVNPIPAITTTPLSKTICSGLSTNIALTASVTGTTFTWTADGSSANITGFSAGSGSTINQVLNNTGNTNETATYHITPAANSCSGSVTNYVVTVNPKPAIPGTVTGQTMVLPGQTGVVYSVPTIVNATGYEWTLPNGAAITAGANTNTITVTFSLSAVSGCISVHGTNNCGNGPESACLNVSLGFNITGTFKYNNAANTPLDSLWVILKQNGVKIDSVRTNLLGAFSFTGKPNGTYTIRATTKKPFMNANGTDALLVQYHFIGNPLLTIPARITAADVNNSGSVNGTDALKIKQRFVGAITSFDRGDWTFEKTTGSSTIYVKTADKDTIIVSGADVSQAFYGLCAGDVNGSNVPSTGAKSSAGIGLLYKDLLKIKPGDEFNIPVYAEQELSVAAISLIVNFPKDLITVEEITSVAGAIIYSVNNGEAKIAWSEIEPVTFRKGEPVFILKAQATSKFTPGQSVRIGIREESEFADVFATPIPGVELSAPIIEPMAAIDMDKDESVITGLTVYPNPARDVVTVDYQTIDASVIEISLHSILGQIILSKEFSHGTGGEFKDQISTTNLQEGVYFLRITEKGNTNAEILNTRLVIRK